mmetsp:Transcript_45514/g.120691  ORF Transcript_45514/g.120691 Transcript_45514/m.120691 type:complete len:87 (-) Transcript_45514:122-382(-)
MAHIGQSKLAARRQLGQTLIYRSCQIENCGICCRSLLPAGPSREEAKDGKTRRTRQEEGLCAALSVSNAATSAQMVTSCCPLSLLF